MFPQHETILRQNRPKKQSRSCCLKADVIIRGNVHGMVILDSTNTILHANPAAERILGKEKLAHGMPLPFPFSGSEPGEISLATDKGIISLEFWGIEAEWDNKPAWLVNLSDITDRNKNERELRKMSRAVLESPAMVVITDAAGNIEFINPKFTEITGYSSQDITGVNLFDNPSLNECPELLGGVRQAVNNGRQWRGELRNCRKNGEIYHHTLSIAPIPDSSGVTTNWVAVMEDVTDRKRDEEQLQNSERQLAEAQKIAHLGSWKRYLDSGKSYWSDEMYRILGLEPGSVPPSQELFLSMVHPDDRQQIQALAREAVQKQTSFSSYLCRIVRPDGSPRILAGQGEILYDRTGTPMMIGTALDVTERETMADEIRKLNAALEVRAAELEAANREMEAFGYTVSHDLRSPLTNVHGYAQVLAELCSEQLDEQCKRYLEEISRGTERMNELIETLLHFSLITSRELSFGQIDRAALVRQTAFDLQMAEPDRRVVFRIEENIMVRGDEGLLKVVVGNLLGNAWKYTGNRETAVIEFGTVERGGKQACFVRDNGIGFDPAEAKDLFAPFHRAVATAEIKGHGIGLATVKRIVVRHGGQVWAEGAPGKGATILFTLPAP